MSVRKRKWRDQHGRQREKWMIHVEYTAPDGRKQTIRKVSPVQTKRGAEQFEREIRAQLLSGDWKGGRKTKQTPTLEAFSKDRASIVPGPAEQEPEPTQLRLAARAGR